jgi:adenosylmethionine-8-amino-7-oxononanoate aminotransferase
MFCLVVLHEPAIEVAEADGDFAKNQQKIFFSDNGSTAVEVAIKVALQYFFNKGKENDNNCFRMLFMETLLSNGS